MTVYEMKNFTKAATALLIEEKIPGLMRAAGTDTYFLPVKQANGAVMYATIKIGAAPMRFTTDYLLPVTAEVAKDADAE